MTTVRAPVSVVVLAGGRSSRFGRDKLAERLDGRTLLTNAIDSMAAIDGPRTLDVKSEPCEGNGLVVSVSDSGSGITPQHLDRIFDPLFTTKSEGMGMGLSICRSIIERHGGRLWVAPNAPKGAVFQFTLDADGPALARA